MLTKKISSIVSVVVLIVLLGLIRTFENELFYDPFLAYFKESFEKKPFPDFNAVPLGWSMLLRYFLNAVLSLGIIYFIFKDFSILKFAAFLYVFFFLILIVLFYLVLYGKGSESAWLLFYVRRFLIQPLFVLLFVPAFYYQLQIQKK